MNKKTKRRISTNIVSAALVGVTAVNMLASQSPLLRTASEFSVHIMLGMLLLGMLFLLADRKTLMFVALGCTAALALWLKNASNIHMKLPSVNKEAKLKVAHINLGNIDDNFFELVDMMYDQNVEVLSFQELTPDWSGILETELKSRFPYKKANVRIDPFGMAVYSKYPFQKTDTILSNGIPMMCIDVISNDKIFHIVSSYLTPALDSKSLKQASAQLKRISQRVNEATDHVIALGEYNMVYWTQEIRDFRSTSNLKNSRRDISQSNLRVPYDHIFYSDDLECIEFKELKSDDKQHLGVVGTYQIKVEPVTTGHIRALSLNEI